MSVHNAYKEICACRVCGNADLTPILHLGDLRLTCVFPRTRDETVASGPLELVKCCHRDDGRSCGLVQLRHSYAPEEMFAENYGYRSSLNQSMVHHLRDIVRRILKRITLLPGDVIIDIGSNDGTLLRFYPPQDLHLFGIDPTGGKFSRFYPDHIRLLPSFFSPAAVKKILGGKRAKVITSIAMIYDLENPVDFMHQVRDLLADDGIWVFEQAYLPSILTHDAYDTICHEHLAYYRLKQIQWMTDRVGLQILDVELNHVNGGSFCVTATRAGSACRESGTRVARILKDEDQAGLDTLTPYREFSKRVPKLRDELVQFIRSIKRQNKLVIGSGASTKGNVVLQFCGFSRDEISCIAEVNPDKFGRYTPGTLIPIVPEREVQALRPDYKLILPWHFRDSFLDNERDYLLSGGSLIFPLPFVEIISRESGIGGRPISSPSA